MSAISDHPSVVIIVHPTRFSIAGSLLSHGRMMAMLPRIVVDLQ